MRVLIVEDDAVLADALAKTLSRAGYIADSVPTAAMADAALATTEVELVVLDIGLPGLDGFGWLKRLRARGGQQGVLVLTARDAVADRVQGLTLGADDYLSKPFASEELLARMAALARRGRVIRSRVIEHGAVTVDLDRNRALLDGAPLELSAREFSILAYLFSNMGAIVGKERIAGAVSAWDEHLSPNAVEVHVSRLRAKLQPAGVDIRTIRGLGYLIEPPGHAKP
jgi:two-component system, OmpR family, response regulator